MNVIFAKMNFKSQSVIHAINAPESFISILNEMNELAKIKSEVGEEDKISFIVVFVTKQQGVDEWSEKISALLQRDALLWFAYPKGTSKKYKCEFHSDRCRLANLGEVGLQRSKANCHR